MQLLATPTPPAAEAPFCDSVVFVPEEPTPTSHDLVSKASLAASLARLFGVEFFQPGDGAADAAWRRSSRPYFVPSDALCARQAARLGIAGWRDLFGGVVAHPFTATKIITHALVRPDAAAPAGWPAAFADRVRPAVLDGYSVFDKADARIAARSLLAGGRVRVKDVNACGGNGQTVIADTDALEPILAALPDVGPWAAGLVLERNLDRVRTCSVGQVRVGRHVLSYHGQQRLTRNHRGHEVYGGSTLHLVRGDFEALLREPMEDALRSAVERALVYHRAATSCIPGMYASRCNYDIAQGLDAAGAWRSGVLEQSWRIGGASGAEIAALHAFEAEPSLRWVDASTHEVYADDADLPPGAELHFDGVDAEAGRLVKYAVVDGRGDD
jgi:hypothetical protein